MSDNSKTPPENTPENTAEEATDRPAVGRIIDQPIDRELAESYLTYAMSTIVDRALPDVRDGLKPSQRRILVAMNDMSLTPGRKHSKCAGIVGETMKKYHPHGDSVIYPTLVHMAQDWKMNALLVDKQGNFGSIDPDPPAAMRYTEARMHQHAMEMLEDLKLDTVDWQSNFDETTLEPKVLPGKLPNLLVNGSTGIAVGMACSMPPHNLGEICDAILAMLDNPDLTLVDLLQIIPGPDFPTGGIICGKSGSAQAYSTGRGRIVVRGKVSHEQTKAGRNKIVITEIPFHVAKNDSIIAKIVDSRKNDRLTDIANITDESSNRVGMRVVIDLKKGADPNVVENQLYQQTPLQSTFSIINISLVKGQPRTLTLKELLQYYIEHRYEVIRRRTAFKLRKAKHEAHRIEGLIYAVCDIDEIIALIRSSRTRDEAIDKLMVRGFQIPTDHPYAPKIPQRLLDASNEKPIKLSRIQAEAIGRLQLIQLVGLEIEKLVRNYAELIIEIEDYEDILANRERIRQIIQDDTEELKTKYARPRRSIFSDEEVGNFDLGALTPEQQVAVTITHMGYVKRLPVEEYRTQGRGGKGVIGANMHTEDFTKQVFVSSTHDDLLCFTNTGRVFKIKVYAIPESSRTSRGRAVVNLLNLKEGERICKFMPIEDFDNHQTCLVFATRLGRVKRTSLAEYRNVNSAGIIAINLREGDELINVTHTNGNDHILLGTSKGMSIRFNENDARMMGRNASGVKGISLAADDYVVDMVDCTQEDQNELLTITENGYGKRTALHEYLVHSEDGSVRTQGRGGKGRRDIATTKRNGRVVATLSVLDTDDLVLISVGGMIVRIEANSIRQTGRGTQGVRVINLKGEDQVASIARIAESDSPESEEASGTPGTPGTPDAPDTPETTEQVTSSETRSD